MPKISELNPISSVTSDDFILVVNDPGGAPSTNKMTVSNFANTVAQFVPYASDVISGTVKVGENLGINSTGFLTSTVSSLPSTGKSEGFVVTWDAVTNAAIWQAFSGVYQYTFVDDTSTYAVIEHDDIIFADCNAVSDDITIVLPDQSSATPPSLGKTYTIKNTQPGNGYKVIVTTDSGISSDSNILENPITGNFVISFDITQKGDVQDFIWDGSVWRHLGSQTLPIFYTSRDTYAQVVVKNASAANNASSDLALYNNEGDENAGTGPFIDIGITSNTYSDTTYGNAWGPSDGYVYNYGGNLIIGPETNHAIKFIAGGVDSTDVKMQIGSSYIAVNSNIYVSKPYFDIIGTHLVEMTASEDGAGSGNSQAYVWAYQETDYAETGQQASNNTTHSTILHQTDGRVNYEGEDFTNDIAWNYTIKPYSNNSIAIVPRTGNSNTWVFDTDGTLTLPGPFNLPYNNQTGYRWNYSVNGPTLQVSNDRTQQVIITGPIANTDYPNSQRIIIQGQRGYGTWGQNTAGEGGDVYIWGGVGGESDIGGASGGDVKVRGGQGQDAQGGYVRIEAGEAYHWGTTAYGHGGFVEINAGDVIDQGGDASNQGGDVTITSGRAKSEVTQSGAIRLRTGGNVVDNVPRDEWIFSSNAELLLPSGGRIGATKGGTSYDGGANGGTTSLTNYYASGNYATCVSSYSDGILRITAYNDGGANPSSEWQFSNTSMLTLPGGIVGSTTTNEYVDTTIELDITATINKLYPLSAGPNQYHLADGVEGQIMYLVPAIGGETADEYTSLNISHARFTDNTGTISGSVYEVTDAVWWLPFRTGAASLTLIFTDGYWNLPHGVFD